MIQRLDQLTAPVEAGRYYLVPTVTGMWQERVRAWPVIGPRHNDTQCLKFGGAPLMLDADGKKAALPPPIWRRRLCRHAVSPSVAAIQPLAARHSRWQCHFDQWTGTQARHDGRGWVCPHRSVPLADHAPDEGGVITCPLHLLRIEAATGKVMPALAVPA
ncbi:MULTISPECIES: Rieske 2Fe-2S domain-containing protein [unclassified Mesorhizobium]|uniref:Rieske 2Fe-2S domain-containing protein n=1 Tax=unclassified Mesorhizobium TaxID=325217 RepID=UPI00112E3B60|nr:MULTISPECIES: Rieske 2Fe-2S domain-containing protein [unclassified Mesorhizobium]TPJ97116.1 Rieske 2Fe-2S domain-containing protein [Mesorhizobium sp. B2-5-12]TPK27218.1 Rieske 2Fe-2S domain-containing protein [Mesorhizobium sp. B2-5-6]